MKEYLYTDILPRAVLTLIRGRYSKQSKNLYLSFLTAHPIKEQQATLKTMFLLMQR